MSKITQADLDHIAELEKAVDDKKHGIRYEYRYTDTDDDSEQETFEVYQNMNESALIEHKGRPCIKVISSVAIVTDINKPKTLGSLADKNRERMIKDGEIQPTEKPDRPFWRPDNDKPLNFDGKSKKEIERYIKHGK